MYETLYSQIIDALVKDGYIILTNALDSKLPQKLKQFTLDETNFKRAGISASSNLHVDNDRRRDKIQWLNDNEASQNEFLTFSKGLQERINRELYMGINYYESHFAIYNEGDFYETHIDAFKNSKNRVVTTVYYLNEEWEDGDGGELVVYDENNNFLAEVSPNANTLIVFLSDKFPHEVKPAKKKRYSIAGWFRVDK